MKGKFGALAMAMMTIAPMSVAAQNDGNQLLTSCKTFLKAIDGAASPNDNQFHAGQCIGKVSGVRATMAMYTQSSAVRNDLQACFPKGVNDGQGVRVVVKFLEDNPRVLNEDGNSLIMVALLAAFPCT